MRIGRNRRRFREVLLLLSIGWAASGCFGSADDLPREGVSGTVTLDGQPLANGTIQFSPTTEGGGPTAPSGGGAKIEDGQFSIPRASGLVAGNYKTSISSAGKRDRTKPAVPGKPAGLAKELVPAKYNAKTTLTAEIKKGGSYDLKYDLQSQ
jgi:hypothetical protein